MDQPLTLWNVEKPENFSDDTIISSTLFGCVGDDFSNVQLLVDAVMQLQEQQEQGLLGPLLPPPSSASISGLFPHATLPAIPMTSAPTIDVGSRPFPVIHSSPFPMAADLGTVPISLPHATAETSAPASAAPHGDTSGRRELLFI